jgi:hypothetical protein
VAGFTAPCGSLTGTLSANFKKIFADRYRRASIGRSGYHKDCIAATEFYRRIGGDYFLKKLKKALDSVVGSRLYT